MLEKKGKQITAIIFVSILSGCGIVTSITQVVTPTTTFTPFTQVTVTPITVNTLDVPYSPTPSPVYTSPPTSTAMPNIPTPIFTPTSTFTLAPTHTASPTLQNPPTRNPKNEFPRNLILDEWMLAENSNLDTASFVPVLGTREEIFQKYQDAWQESFNTFPDPLTRGYYNRVMLNGRALIIHEEITYSKSIIHVFYDGKEITQVDAGYVGPHLNVLRVWTYENHWIMEYVTSIKDPYGSFYELGNIIWDGESLNSKFNYQESFGLTAINGRVFYFFRRNDRFGISYDGTEYNMDYESVFGYRGEWSERVNHQGIGTWWQRNRNISFFAEQNGSEYFVVIWAK